MNNEPPSYDELLAENAELKERLEELETILKEHIEEADPSLPNIG